MLTVGSKNTIRPNIIPILQSIAPGSCWQQNADWKHAIKAIPPMAYFLNSPNATSSIGGKKGLPSLFIEVPITLALIIALLSDAL